MATKKDIRKIEKSLLEAEKWQKEIRNDERGIEDFSLIDSSESIYSGGIGFRSKEYAFDPPKRD